MKNLNYSELNTVIIHRLYHVLRDLKSDDEKYKKYIIARNSLDFSTAFLPLIGVLVASYGLRMVELERVASKYQIPSSLVQRQRDYLEMKKNYNSNLYGQYAYKDMLQNFSDDFQILKFLQMELQNGVLFKQNKRRMLSSVLRLDLKNFIISLEWQKRLNMLCEELFELINKYDFTENEMQHVKKQMLELFGYC